MYIKHDYTYIAASSERLAKNGFGKQTVFSLTLGRYFTEAERQENSRIANSCTREEWSERCDAFSKSLDKPLSEIMKILCEKYDIHQTTQEKSSIHEYLRKIYSDFIPVAGRSLHASQTVVVHVS